MWEKFSRFLCFPHKDSKRHPYSKLICVMQIPNPKEVINNEKKELCHDFNIELNTTKTISENVPSIYDHPEIFFSKKQLRKYNFVRLLIKKDTEKVDSYNL